MGKHVELQHNRFNGKTNHADGEIHVLSTVISSFPHYSSVSVSFPYILAIIIAYYCYCCVAFFYLVLVGESDGVD